MPKQPQGFRAIEAKQQKKKKHFSRASPSLFPLQKIKRKLKIKKEE
jgi:hypothetical protein